MIGTLLEIHQEKRAVEAHGARTYARVGHCPTHDDLCDCAENCGTSAIVADICLWPAGGVRMLARRLEARKDPLVLHVVHDLSPRAVRELPFLTGIEHEVHLIYRRYHDIEHHLENRWPGGLRSATLPILRRIGSRLGDNVAHVFICCLVLCERGTTIKWVASELGFNVKRVRAIFKAAGLPTFKTIRPILRIAHAIHRMDVLGVGEQIAADGGGFGSARHMENYVKHHTGLTPHQLVDRGGFERMLEGILKWFESSVARSPRAVVRNNGISRSV